MTSYGRTMKNFSGYSGYILYVKIRLVNGGQLHIDRLKMLHSWHSALRAYLPIVYEKKMGDYTEKENWGGFTLQDLMGDADKRIKGAYKEYNPIFEGQSCGENEKSFLITMSGIEEVLDEITAITKIIDRQQIDEDSEDVFG